MPQQEKRHISNPKTISFNDEPATSKWPARLCSAKLLLRITDNLGTTTSAERCQRDSALKTISWSYARGGLRAYPSAPVMDILEGVYAIGDASQTTDETYQRCDATNSNQCSPSEETLLGMSFSTRRNTYCVKTPASGVVMVIALVPHFEHMTGALWLCNSPNGTPGSCGGYPICELRLGPIWEARLGWKDDVWTTDGGVEGNHGCRS